MNVHEACALLDIPVCSDQDLVKAAFKKKAIEFHPDKNKAPNAEEKFKEINSAYQFLEKYGTNPQIFHPGFQNFYDPSAHFAEELKRQMNVVFNIPGPPLVASLTISFEISVLGGPIEMSYARNLKCPDCQEGHVRDKNPCPKCNGKGRRKYGEGSQELKCNKCLGTGFPMTGVCPSCQGSSKVFVANNLISIKIPPGTENGAKLIFKGRGNYRANDQYDDFIVSIFVTPSDHGLILSGQDVIFTIELSLLEALKGTKKNLWTIKGEKVLEFKPKMKNGDKIRIAGFGVIPNGSHICVVNVNYPEDVSKLIAILEQPENQSVSE
jgi:molecular chaperone DnaJ